MENKTNFYEEFKNFSFERIMVEVALMFSERFGSNVVEIMKEASQGSPAKNKKGADRIETTCKIKLSHADKAALHNFFSANRHYALSKHALIGVFTSYQGREESDGQ